MIRWAGDDRLDALFAALALHRQGDEARKYLLIARRRRARMKLRLYVHCVA
jgi:hypothetical protein